MWLKWFWWKLVIRKEKNMSIEKSKSIGGLYNKVSQKGLDYLNGFINIEGKKLKIVAFKNNMKATDTTPDYSIFVSEPNGAPMATGNENRNNDPLGFED